MLLLLPKTASAVNCKSKAITYPLVQISGATSAGQMVGVEVKAAATVRESDLRGLRKLSNLAGNQFKRGILLYDGDEAMPLGNNIWAAPLSSLWGK